MSAGSTPSSPHRRTFLIGGLAASAALLGGSLAGIRYAVGPGEWIEEVVRRHLPGVLIDDASLARFAQDLLKSDFLSYKARLAMAADEAIPGLRRIAPERERMELLERREILERRVLTEFLMGSNFFRGVDPLSQRIVYSAKVPACDSPFAILSDA